MSAPAVSGVLLAAGLSRRFGDDPPKQLVEIDGAAQVRRTAVEALASALAELVVVTGHRAAEVREALNGLEVHFVDNPDYAAGQAGSVARGASALRPEAAAALFLPCDQPFLDRETIGALVESYTNEPCGILVPSHAGRRGSPVLFDRRLFDELATLSGDEGGRQLFANHPERLRTLELPSERPLLDFDTREELAALGLPIPDAPHV